VFGLPATRVRSDISTLRLFRPAAGGRRSAGAQALRDARRVRSSPGTPVAVSSPPPPRSRAVPAATGQAPPVPTAINPWTCCNRRGACVMRNAKECECDGRHRRRARNLCPGHCRDRHPTAKTKCKASGLCTGQCALGVRANGHGGAIPAGRDPSRAGLGLPVGVSRQTVRPRTGHRSGRLVAERREPHRC
jgi:hypothetical protein